ncbi:MAG: type II toxin-antitoxin system HicA family toxin [Desulfobacterales bacterium]|nr:type II toxin-antitoxin system HicA family toxin [Desulfobacterales bacterium]
MGTVPVLKPNKVMSMLERLGFLKVRQKGSHKQFRHPDGGNNSAVSYRQGYIACFAKENRQGHQADC